MADFFGFFGLGGGGGGGGGGGVTSLNGETGAVNIIAGSNITVTPAGQNITIAATGSAGSPFQEVPAGAINGVNRTFTLSQAPGVNASLSVYLDGLVLDQGVDYTIAGTTITFPVGHAPNFAQTLYAVYTTVAAVGPGVTTLNGLNGAVVIDNPNNGLAISAGGSNVHINVLSVLGTSGAPNLITAVGGVPFATSTLMNKVYIEGSGGAVTVTANPQIAAGSFDGQLLDLESVSGANTVTLQGNVGTVVNGLALNGNWVGGFDSMITLSWDATASVWVERGRQ